MAEAPQPAAANAEVCAGTLVGVLGLRGELKLDASRVGEDAVRPGLAAVLRARDGRERPVEIAALRRHKGRLVVRLTGIDDVTAAAALVPAELWLPRHEAALRPGEYLDADLCGCRIVDPAGVDRGEVVEVSHYPAQDMLVVGPGRAMLPLVHAFVRAIDIGAKRIVVDVPPGLLDGAAEEA